MNPKFNRDEKKILIISDTSLSECGPVLSALEEHLKENGFQPVISQRHIPSAVFDKTRELYHKEDPEKFEKAFSSITQPVDLGLLLQFSERSNPDFFTLLERAVRSGAGIKGAVWDQYCHNLSKGAIQSDCVGLSFANMVFKQMGPGHQLYLLFNHNLTSPSLSAFGELGYHMVGRGMVACGINGEVQTQRNNGEYFVVLNLAAVGSADTQEQITYSIEILHHELNGHAILGLKDHFHPVGCVMDAKPSARDYIASGSRNNGKLYLCDSCMNQSEPNSDVKNPSGNSR